MIVPGSASPLLTTTDGGYTIAKSLRFRRSASAYLNRTPASSGNRKTWTFSTWIKRGLSGTANQKIFSVFNGNNDNQLFELTIYNDKIYLEAYSLYWRISSQVIRDHSAWYHITLTVDTTQSTANDRIKLYINGTQVTAFDTTNNPSQNADLAINQAAAHYIGSRNGVSDYLDGYQSDVNFIDGQALTPSSFGETDSVTGVWKPKAYSGTYGTNGFYLKFTDVATTSGSNAGLGKDFSGNGNYWTTNNISVTSGSTYDSMKDVPTLTDTDTANYCVLNPLDKNASTTLTEGNLSNYSSSASWQGARATFAINTGKWYIESDITNHGVGYGIGFATSAWGLGQTAGDTNASGIYWDGGGTYYYWFTSTVSNASFTPVTGDSFLMAIDMDAGKVWLGYRHTGTVTWIGSGNPSAGTNPTFTFTANSTYFPCITTYNTTQRISINFGQRPFGTTPPTGFKALNTYNLPDSTIVAGNKVMDATTYTGAGAPQTVTNAGGFKPDLVWVKSRSTVHYHALMDSVRGTGTKALSSNTTGTESDLSIYANLTSFNSNGFTAGTTSSTNILADSGQTFVAWQWQAGQGSTSSNTNGSITSTVSVNATAGFSIVTYTGTGANSTIGHGLGVAPSMIIIKCRNNTTDWPVYHKSLGATKYLKLNTTGAAGTLNSFWNDTAPTSSVFTIGTPNGDVNSNGNTYVAYCWAEIAGLSKFGSYTGNGSTDGVFVYTGFRPKYVLIKNSSVGNGWNVQDSTRSTYNQVNTYLFPQDAAAEASTYAPMDFLSNGFKLRGTDAFINGNGNTMIYAAFAENPFKNALAR